MSVNKVILIGRLGRDPETRYMPNGDAITNFSLATDEQWRDRNGERQTRTEWHNVSLYGKLGEIANQYLRKGSQVFVEGKIQSRKYTDKDGIERMAYNIIGNEMKMPSNRNDGSDSGNNNAAPLTSSNPPPAPHRQPPQHESTTAPIDDIDDDIPF
ncbi:single-stranded DNA-binding protein [Snodgrassella alvi]|uniref:single-stranded DNA-binding protein n=1 Tax=Snodgrassella TaxID=1193515 RepID=UPI0009FFF7DE|nr:MULTISPECIES: single-stranded DNA-binding protein [Snodgrassella]MBI0098344.1 single-stranded DNA-binding protein [Snodgrassella sp. W8134]MBI0102135.1 single-stranded DNA-binding protein [Snodgrassella sp. W8135]MBI0159360.1 single-stranded DNA-binding protein [Snodgrassella sp. W6238H11]MBI0161472.1 single-stranded DNA-binding protein [Snodgrassella sp. W6238H14]MBI0182109.1 single-stranded DNA-binding protein [Snodgrassella sp. W8158]